MNLGGWIPRDFWLEQWEKEAIEAYFLLNPKDGYRRLTFKMLDADVVAVSPSSTYRVLKAAGLLQRWNRKASKKGTGFQQPDRPHEHWHVDVCYIQYLRDLLLPVCDPRRLQPICGALGDPREHEGG